MADVIPTLTLVNMLKLALNSEAAITLHLYKNSIVPSSTIGVGAFLEASFSGYAEIVLTPSVAPSESEDGLAETQQMDALFEHDGGPNSCDVYGYYLTQGSGLGLQLIDYNVDEEAPVSMSTLGDAYEFAVTILAVQE